MRTLIGGVDLTPGTRLLVDSDRDYLYGLGPVAVTVREVLALITHHGETWCEMQADRTVMGGAAIPRVITIRVGALRAAAARAQEAEQ